MQRVEKRVKLSGDSSTCSKDSSPSSSPHNDFGSKKGSIPLGIRVRNSVAAVPCCVIMLHNMSHIEGN